MKIARFICIFIHKYFIYMTIYMTIGSHYIPLFGLCFQTRYVQARTASCSTLNS